MSDSLKPLDGSFLLPSGVIVISSLCLNVNLNEKDQEWKISTFLSIYNRYISNCNYYHLTSNDRLMGKNLSRQSTIILDNLVLCPSLLKLLTDQTID